MKNVKFYLSSILLIAFSMRLIAQNAVQIQITSEASEQEPCGTMQNLAEMMKKDPSLSENSRCRYIMEF